jgi:WD40 repeat protein
VAVSGSYRENLEEVIQLWNMESFQLYRTYKPSFEPEWMSILRFNPKGDLIAVSGSSGVYFIDPFTGERLMTLSAAIHDESSVWINNIVFSPDGTLLSTADLSGAVFVWGVSL